ncbi:MAG: MarR family winged helix-turn-helix transcriptional regulator [Planctomycetota bacterium]
MPSSNTSTPRNLQQEVGKREPFAIPEQEAYLNIVRSHAVLSGAFAALFKEHGLSEPQYNALRIIAGAGPSGIRSETVGARMVARDPDTTRLIDRLQRAGYVHRSKAEDDRRCVVVTITSDGRTLLRRLRRRVEDLHREQLGHLSRAELRELNRVLFKARNS